MREAIDAVGASLHYLPHYSPDFNPIAHVFSKLKSMLRANAECMIDVLWNAVGEVVTLFESDKFANYFVIFRIKGCAIDQVHHGSATTTAAVRRAIQHSQENLRALAKRDGINQKTAAKCKKRSSVADLPTGPKEPRSTVLSPEEKAVIVTFRRYTVLPLDDCLYVSRRAILALTQI